MSSFFLWASRGSCRLARTKGKVLLAFWFCFLEELEIHFPSSKQLRIRRPLPCLTSLFIFFYSLKFHSSFLNPKCLELWYIISHIVKHIYYLGYCLGKTGIEISFWRLFWHIISRYSILKCQVQYLVREMQGVKKIGPILRREEIDSLTFNSWIEKPCFFPLIIFTPSFSSFIKMETPILHFSLLFTAQCSPIK